MRTTFCPAGGEGMEKVPSGPVERGSPRGRKEESWRNIPPAVVENSTETRAPDTGSPEGATTVPWMTPPRESSMVRSTTSPGLAMWMDIPWPASSEEPAERSFMAAPTMDPGVMPGCTHPSLAATRMEPPTGAEVISNCPSASEVPVRVPPKKAAGVTRERRTPPMGVPVPSSTTRPRTVPPRPRETLFSLAPGLRMRSLPPPRMSAMKSSG